ncbi:MAG TPA: penicillin-binding transpeptidase domain-containing protein [Candidatus Acidoferrales bacterium]|jgi:cell division protein FtsI (penicillin-binding protein 3)|nr:penicillin-binding transpeptidase domain-containing protein [Candidatus Acidoferrales bacterium]
MEQEKVHVRLLILAAFVLFWMTAVFGRVAYLQLFLHSDYLTRAARQQRHTIDIYPKRGVIYDRNMHPLAMSVPVQSAFAVPAEIKDRAMVARLLSVPLGMPAEEIREKLDSGSPFVWIKRKLTPATSEEVQSANLKGIYLQEENQRYYPKRELGAHVLGFVDVDEKGLGGIEREYDNLIRGKDEKVVVMADARQRWFDGGEAERDRGVNVVLTLDEKIQYIAERELVAAIEKTHAPAGTVIVQDPNSGAILALANWPKFNPNAAFDVSGERKEDRAISQIYEPGSTFKLITLAAAFDQNLIRADEVFNCENGAVTVAGHLIHDHKKYGMLTVADILANSSDVGAIKIALRLGSPKFYDYIRAFGFGNRTGVDLPDESRGLVNRLEHWGSYSIASVSMGQEVGVTPLQMITAVSAIANGGLLYKPHIVDEMKRGDVTLSLEGPSAITDPKRIIRPETAATLRHLMEGVVLHGTGPKARLDGWSVAGKTGTAQKIDPNTGRYSPKNVIASFTGFAPINNPSVTILVSIDSPGGYPHGGGEVAAPVFKRIAEQILPYLDVPQDIPVSPQLIQTSYRKNNNNEAEDGSLDDLSAVDFNAQPEVVEESAKPETAKMNLPKSPEVLMSADEGGDIAVPDFSGKTMRDVTEACMRLGLDPVLIGTNVAIQQTPAAGAKLRRGAKVTVEFGDTPAHSRKSK